MPDLIGFVRKGFPIMSAFSSLAGPLGPVVAGLVGKAIGVDKLSPAPADIAAAIAGATPEQMVQLKQVEADLQIRMQQMGFQNVEDLEKLAVEDRESARNMEVATKGRTAPAMAWVIVLSFGITVIMVLTGHAKVEAAFAGALVGYLANNATQVITYYFGSSAGSDRKTELLAAGK